MVRTVVNHGEDERTHDSSSPEDSVRVDQKVDASRSKHSETEQRRRSKINERFQTLRDLIPENDQKRDKASLLLEVIQYIQFLQEKLQVYEGTYQGWSPEPTKLTPWKLNSGPPVERFLAHSQFERHVSSVHEDSVILNASLSNTLNLVESDLPGAGLCTPTDNPSIAANQTLPLHMPMQPPTLEGVLGQIQQECFPESEHLIHQSLSQFWPRRSRVDDCSVPVYTANEDELKSESTANEDELKSESGEASISSAYSQGLLNSLTIALKSSGVDLSRTSISVKLDVGKQTSCGSTVAMDHSSSSRLKSVASENIVENYEHAHKRFRSEQS